MEELRGREAYCGQNPENRTVARTGFKVQGCPGSIQLFGCLLLSSVSQMGLPLSRVRSELQMTRPTCPELGSVWCTCPGLSCKAVASWRRPYCVSCCSSPSQPQELTSVGEQVTQDHCIFSLRQLQPEKLQVPYTYLVVCPVSSPQQEGGRGNPEPDPKGMLPSRGIQKTEFSQFHICQD